MSSSEKTLGPNSDPAAAQLSQPPSAATTTLAAGGAAAAEAPHSADAAPVPDKDGGDVHGVNLEFQESTDSVSKLPAPGRSASRQQFGDSQVQASPDTKPDEIASNSHMLLQNSLPQIPVYNVELETRASGLKHIGFGPLKKENQDEYFIQVGGFGGQKEASCYAIFDGHGSYGSAAAAFCCRELPQLFEKELQRAFQEASDNGVKFPLCKEQIDPILSASFVETEARLLQAGVNVSSSGTTASVVYQHGPNVWVAAVGDSRAVCLSSDSSGSSWRVQPLTLDHRPARRTEKYRVEAAGGRVEPKRLPTGKTVGEPRLWLAHIPSPGLLLSRSIGDEMATSVGCTSRPEITYMALRPHKDHYLVIASDGVWDVLSNDVVAQAVTSTGNPEEACAQVLDAALAEWEERLAADNISVIVLQLLWGEGQVPTSSSSSRGGAAAATAARPAGAATPLSGSSRNGSGAHRGSMGLLADGILTRNMSAGSSLADAPGATLPAAAVTVEQQS